MKLYNTLSKKLEDLEPLAPPVVSLYTCGPTVYDRAHIGNLRTYIFEDTLRRVLKAEGYRVKHAMNITDVDDKTIGRSRDDYPDEEPLEALKKLTAKYEQLFLDDVKKVGIDLAGSQIIRATDEMGAMRELIEQIPNKYTSQDGIYFSIEKYPDYGVFVRLDRSHPHHRITNDEYDKEHVADFALWKTKKSGEPSWPFELEDQVIDGRPGWHLECSAIAMKYLGESFDIHTGGVDLVFPHHENEVAQAKAATGKDLAKLFVHAQHLLVDGKKMSKSLDNFYSLEDVQDEGYDPLVFRLLVLQAHYRTQMVLTWDNMEAAKNTLNNFYRWSDLQFQSLQSDKLKTNYDQELKAIHLAMSNDLNTPQALAIFNGMVKRVEELGADSEAIAQAAAYLDDYLGLNLRKRTDTSAEQQGIITDRETARLAKNWSAADKLREQLLEQGLEVNDTDQGPTWSRL